MLAYMYNEDKQFIGTTKCQIDPIRSKRAQKEVYLLPANCTFAPPPEIDKDKEIVLWRNGEWAVVDKEEYTINRFAKQVVLDEIAFSEIPLSMQAKVYQVIQTQKVLEEPNS